MKLKKGLVWREIEGKIFIIDSENQTLHSLNETAAIMWKMFLKNKNISEIANKIKSKYNIDEKNCLRDIEEFLSELKERGLIYEE